MLLRELKWFNLIVAQGFAILLCEQPTETKQKKTTTSYHVQFFDIFGAAFHSAHGLYSNLSRSVYPTLDDSE